MFIREGDKWYYACNGCDATTQQYNVHESPSDRDRAWRDDDMHDVHWCPECRKVSRLISGSEEVNID